MFGLFSSSRTVTIPRPPRRLKEPEQVSWMQLPKLFSEAVENQTPVIHDRTFILPQDEDFEKIEAWLQRIAANWLHAYPYRPCGNDCDSICQLVHACRPMLYPSINAVPMICKAQIKGHMMLAMRTTEEWRMVEPQEFRDSSIDTAELIKLYLY